jgi:hypothetical protein
MLRKLACAVFVMVVAVSFVVAEEWSGRITKIDGKNITFQKTKKGKDDGEAVVLNAEGATVAKGSFDKDTKKFVKGDEVKGGLKTLAEMVTKAGEKGVGARVTTDDSNKKATQILTTGKGGKKKAAE